MTHNEYLKLKSKAESYRPNPELDALAQRAKTNPAEVGQLPTLERLTYARYVESKAAHEQLRALHTQEA
jgi:hypothetical protein